MHTRVIMSVALRCSLICVVCAVCVGVTGCYDVVPDEETFGAKVDASLSGDTGGTDAIDAAGQVDTEASDGALATDGGATDGGATDGGATDGGATDGGGKACLQDKECGASAAGCVVPKCVKGTCALLDKPEGAGCTSSDPCRTDTTCQKGVCTGGTNILCECDNSKDCAAPNKGNKGKKCLGEFYCDTSQAIRKCKVNPVTVPKCPEVDPAACIESWQCDDATGACEAKLKSNDGPGAACDDGDFCTTGDHCADGVCLPGSVPNCSCKSDADCASKGSLCGGTYYCDTLSTTPNCKLIPSTSVVCDASKDGPCAVNTCDPAKGTCAMKATAKQFVPCDDGNPCTDDDSCKAGKCVSGTDICGCKEDASCAQFDDGDPCNGTFYCDKTAKIPTCKLNPATVVVCPVTKNSTCQTNTCDKLTGACALSFANKYDKCDADGTPCTVGDWCDGKGACKAGTDVCTCKITADCASKEDGNLCNGTLFCDTSGDVPTCKVDPKTITTCAGTNEPCTQNVCEPKTGKCKKSDVATNTPCDDGQICTKFDTCAKGKCVPGADFCACKADADCLGDGDLCKGKPYCDKSGGQAKCGVLKGTAVTCNNKKDGACFTSTCAPLTGTCVSKPDSSVCADDSNPCTAQLCDPTSKQCVTKNLANDTACGSGKVCAEGACVGAVAGMVLTAAGEGWAGCTTTNYGPCPVATTPAKKVSLKAVLIDRHEVTVAQYEACVQAKKCDSPPATTPATCNWAKKADRLQHPVNCVTWLQADAYCKAQKKRLPTEAEWERAARGGCDQAKGPCKPGTRVFPWGNQPASCFWAVMKGNGAAGCGLGTTRIVGTYTKDESPYGAQDMGGNVAEWVVDTWATDALGKWNNIDPVTTGGTTHTVKGGHLAASGADVRAFMRVEGKAGPTVGFRCVQDL